MPTGETRRNRDEELKRFEAAVLPHLGAVQAFARWLTGHHQDVDDIVQEALLKAFRFYGDARGADVKPWLLAITRNTARSWFRRPPLPAGADPEEVPADRGSPQEELARKGDAEAVRRAVAALPDEFREVIVLREFEDLSYKEIAVIVACPVGTVMSRLSRGRDRLAEALAAERGGAS